MNFKGTSDAEILAIAEPFLDNIIAGSNELNYLKFSRDLSDEMKSTFSESDFLQQQRMFQEKVGKVSKQREFIRCIRRREGVSILWITSFENVGGEVLVAMQIDEIDGVMKVLAARIS